MNISKVTNYIINQIHSPTFIEQHKFRIQDFTRDRILNFQILFVTIMRKSIKSLQIVLNELFMDGHIETTVTNSAFTQARQKLSHTAFLELSKDIVAMQYEEPKDLNLWNGYRLLGVDSSQIILPYTKEIMTEFGSIKIKTAAIDGAYVSARFECCYDVLNRLTIAGTLDKGDTYEVELAERILDAAVENDILIYDRGYCSYKFIAILLQQKKHFVIRCKRSFFKAVTAFFNGEQADKVFNIPVPAAQNKVIKYLGLPLTITVRFVAVPLPTGEIEVLMTSLLDSNINKEEFKKLYGFRWEVETFFGVLKSRLSLENFTGLTVEAIKQDFWSTIFISNYETILTFNINKKMKDEKASSAHKQLKEASKVNKAVTFNIIKHQAIDILLNPKQDTESKIQELTILFKIATIPIRKNRTPPRKKTSYARSYNFQLRKKKHVY